MESGGADVSGDFCPDVSVPTVDFALGGERDVIESTLLAPLLPSPRDERGGREAGVWKVVDDFVDEFLGNRVHGIGGCWKAERNVTCIRAAITYQTPEPQLRGKE